ncbi:hypothetical protein B0H16DRAFT_1454056 [Mycena metata]|uniref:Uncharacterized protein n=1 Tax=Mycena metata TaxID=1033252 RepID=A0AAD7JJH8_9AGAR|nr:hypothetical protein B0H16DRAFT_1454056 [Mycena metata]
MPERERLDLLEYQYYLGAAVKRVPCRTIHKLYVAAHIPTHVGEIHLGVPTHEVWAAIDAHTRQCCVVEHQGGTNDKNSNSEICRRRCSRRLVGIANSGLTKHCSPAARVEEYWQRKGVAGQHMYSESFFGGAPEDEFDTLRDEVRTLRVKLNQIGTGGQRTLPTQQTYMVNNTVQPSAAAQPFANQATPVATVNMEELGRTVFNAMRMGSPPQDQYVQTRSGARTVAFANPPEQDF